MNILVDPGNLVGNGEATELASLQQLDPMYVYFSINELNQLFEYKADIEYHQLSYGRNEELGMEIGCNIVCYTVTEDGRGFDGYNIDLEGKLAEAKKVALPGF